MDSHAFCTTRFARGHKEHRGYTEEDAQIKKLIRREGREPRRRLCSFSFAFFLYFFLSVFLLRVGIFAFLL